MGDLRINVFEDAVDRGRCGFAPRGQIHDRRKGPLLEESVDGLDHALRAGNARLHVGIVLIIVALFLFNGIRFRRDFAKDHPAPLLHLVEVLVKLHVEPHLLHPQPRGE